MTTAFRLVVAVGAKRTEITHRASATSTVPWQPSTNVKSAAFVPARVAVPRSIEVPPAFNTWISSAGEVVPTTVSGKATADATRSRLVATWLFSRIEPWIQELVIGHSPRKSTANDVMALPPSITGASTISNEPCLRLLRLHDAV